MIRDPDLLAGTTVLDLGIWRPAPFGSQLLAELGAAVTKIEPPGGDPMRAFPSLYHSLNSYKKVEEINLKSAPGRARVLELAAQSDVVVEGFRPGVADRLGVGYESVALAHPGVVYCSVSGFGQGGPFAEAPGHDLNYQSWAGVLAARMPEIDRPGIPVGDLAGGAYAALSVCAALLSRQRTGRGCRIDVSITDVLVSWAGPDVDGPLTDGDDPGANFPAYGTFACQDGWLTLGVVTEDHFWRALCDELELGEVRSLDTAGRMVAPGELRTALADALRQRHRDAVVDALLAAGVPVAPVLTAAEAVRHSVATADGLSTTGLDGNVRLAHPVRFELTPPFLHP